MSFSIYRDKTNDNAAGPCRVASDEAASHPEKAGPLREQRTQTSGPPETRKKNKTTAANISSMQTGFDKANSKNGERKKT